MKEIKNLKIESNPINGGYCARFDVDDKSYYADICSLMFGGDECMIFAVENNQVNWSDLYCNRNVDVSESDLRYCINEFVESLSD